MNVNIILVKILENASIRELDMNARAGLVLQDETVRIVSSVACANALEVSTGCWLDFPSE